MNKKKSFLLHLDSLEILNELTNEQCGLLFKACRDFNYGLEIDLDPVLSLVFFSFKKQFERDGVKYKSVVDRNKVNGSKGGRPKKQDNPSEPKKASGLIDNPSEPKKADSVNDSVNVNGSDSGNDKEVINDRFAEFWDLYGKKTDSSKCKAKFSKLTSTEIVLIFTNLPLYIKSTPDKQYRKNPITWLNGKCWNDEIIQQVGQAQSVHTFEHQNYQSGKF